jgi:hypothetical protein
MKSIPVAILSLAAALLIAAQDFTLGLDSQLPHTS